MKIWVDIVNSPHVLFFQPIIKALEKGGHGVSITARAYAQTIGMLDELGIDYTQIGAHAGARITDKAIDLFSRSVRLLSYADTRNFNLALTFNSASLVLAARILRIPSVVFMDYEYQPLNHFTFRLCDRVITPAIFPRKMLQKYGAMHKTRTFSGFKEQLYLSKSRYQTSLLKKLSIDQRRILITVRPPATMALYHHFENDLFYTVVSHVLRNKNVVLIGLPRDDTQKNMLLSLGAENMYVPDDAIDGRQLLDCTDIMISAGGTMNREAAVLGIPTYSVFRGEVGAVDQYLISLGRMISLRHLDDLAKIHIRKTRKRVPLFNKLILDEILSLITQFAAE